MKLWVAHAGRVVLVGVYDENPEWLGAGLADMYPDAIYFLAGAEPSLPDD